METELMDFYNVTTNQDVNIYAITVQAAAWSAAPRMVIPPANHTRHGLYPNRYSK